MHLTPGVTLSPNQILNTWGKEYDCLRWPGVIHTLTILLRKAGKLSWVSIPKGPVHETCANYTSLRPRKLHESVRVEGKNLGSMEGRSLAFLLNLIRLICLLLSENSLLSVHLHTGCQATPDVSFPWCSVLYIYWTGRKIGTVWDVL